MGIHCWHVTGSETCGMWNFFTWIWPHGNSRSVTGILSCLFIILSISLVISALNFDWWDLWLHIWASIVFTFELHSFCLILYHDFFLLCGMHRRWYTWQNCWWEGWDFQGGYNSCISKFQRDHYFCNLLILSMVTSYFSLEFQLSRYRNLMKPCMSLKRKLPN